MAKGNRVGVKRGKLRRVRQREEDSEESDEEYKVAEDEDCEESDEYCSLDGDESEEILADFEVSRRAVRSRNTRRSSSIPKGDGIKNPKKNTRVLYKKDEDFDDEDDDDDDHMKKPKEKRREIDDEDDEEFDEEEEEYDDGDDAEFKSDHMKKPKEKRREIDDEDDEEFDEEEEEEYDDEDDAEFLSLVRESKQIKEPKEKARVSYTELDDEVEDDYAEVVPSGRNRNQEKKRVPYTEGEAKNMVKVNQKKNLREKRKVSYTEDDDDEDYFEFTSTRKKRNSIKDTREKKMVSYEEDNQEDEDENDAEFMLSESDFVDYDEESPKAKKSDHTQKKCFWARHKKSKKSKTKKSTRPKQRNLSQKSCYSRGKPNTNIEKRSKKVSRRRVTPESDADFASSASSDHEYTISEEEREQMREARVYCANLRAKLRSTSNGKQEEERKNPVRKGKEKVEEDETGKQVCGICLSEEGKRTVRGVLNCCQHYFCFACIMEWSKVESRCPLCKQRFSTITKYTKLKSHTGFDLRTVVIPVPECDQVYQPSEEELRGYLDPYESVICTECHHGGEDALMLLCDICDSPAHTFCVGLGREVPEGNWYCEGCRPTVFSSQASDRRLNNNPSSPIGGGFDLNELYVPETPLTQQIPVGDFLMPAPVATTLRDRRRIHRHRFLNNNRINDFVSRTTTTPTSSSSGIRLFGSQLDQRNDITNLFSSRSDQFEVQNLRLLSAEGEHSGSGMGFDSRSGGYGQGQLHPCANRSTIGSDAGFTCREAIGPSRTSQGGLHAP